jgi:S1-C subfamily serine protease
LKKFKIISTILINIFLVSSFTGCTVAENKSSAQKNTTNTTSTNPSPITIAAEKIIPSVVGITATFLGDNNKDVQGVGSGMIIDSGGYILTNNHVAGINSKSIKISLYDGRDVDGKSIWSNETLDLSIIKINEKNLPSVQFGDSSTVRIGETAIAIGNPLGLKFQRTVTSGIISAVNRTIEISEGNFMEDLIQTDASINPGNSGGPLSNINGDVIAINSAKITSAEGIGFAVPINIVKPVLKSLKETGKFDTPIIGIIGFDKSMSGYLNINFQKGIYIYNVSAGSGSYEAGLKKGDIILSINGKELKSMNDLRETVYTIGAGKTIKVRVKTAAGEKDFDVKIKSMS